MNIEASDENMRAAADWSAGRRVTVGDMFLGLYQPSPETTEYWHGIERRELLFKHCRQCGAAHHPRRMLCSRCNSMDLAWRPASGQGEVYSFSEVHRAPTPAFQAGAPYTVGLVHTAEGVYFFCRIVAEGGAAIRIGASARLDFRPLENGLVLPVFVVGGQA
ncbi:hypothetical protein GCM10023144_37380 [Pigmentiphaga soli]|uniref:DUF35 domain-containing protein n=1 Tax=Pigmentiphaga soli TaxID=1007095 RepID=A0ABP8HHM5_9BURK